MPLAKWSAVALSSALIACSSSSDSSSATFPASALTTVTSASGAHTLEVRTSPSQPPSRGTSSVEFIVRDQQGALEDGLTIDVTPWMPAMGHGTSVVPEVSQTAEGTYVARNVALFMPGFHAGGRTVMAINFVLMIVYFVLTWQAAQEREF